MSAAPARGLLQFLHQIPDPRGRKGQRHSLVAMLATVVCAVLSGARGYEAITQWIHLQEPWLWHLLGYYRKPPSANCFRDLLMALPPEALEESLRQWLSASFDQGDDPEAMAIDGKTLRGTFQCHRRSVQLLAAIDHQSGCVLGQTFVPENTNEHKAALRLLRSLVLEGRVVTADAAFCQRDVCQSIIDNGGDYVLSVKENQPDLKRNIAHEFAASDEAFSPLPTAQPA